MQFDLDHYVFYITVSRHFEPLKVAYPCNLKFQYFLSLGAGILFALYNGLRIDIPEYDQRVLSLCILVLYSEGNNGGFYP